MQKKSSDKLNFKEVDPSSPINLDETGQEKALDSLGQKISGWEEQHQHLNEVGEEIKKLLAEELAGNEQIAQLAQYVKNLEVENSYLRSVVQTLKEENKDQKEKVHDMEARLAELNSQNLQLQSELKTKTGELESAQQDKLVKTEEPYQYDNLSDLAQKIITRQSQEIEKLKNRFASKLRNNDQKNQERIAKLKNRIYSLENLIQRYKEQGYGS